METARLFVYGTLRRGSNNKFARLLAAHARFIGPARIAGRLYSFGSYPGATPSDTPGEWVRGEIFRLDQPARILPALDAYEGRKYERTIALVHPASGIRINAWVYFHRGKPTGPRIISGVWPRRR
jgi:gamma-glutamylcyclotransferase (GGCT)/AIG2-like uncharacterized protein YtfP